MQTERHFRARFFLPLLFASASALAAFGQAAQPPVPYGDALQRAKAIVAKMTLQERLDQMHGTQDATRRRIVVGLPRLGIPDLHITNGPAGVGHGGIVTPPATAFPAPIAVAATWDPELARLEGRVMGEETRMLGSGLLESPDINIARVPQGGRVFESYGEDPFLASRIAVANIEGIQSTWMIANVKHYVANNQETDRHTINEIVDERALREIYLPAFKAAIQEAHVASLMCAYPQVNGEFNCANKHLLRDVLLNEWKFDGFITSDFGAVQSTVPSLEAGLDLELPTGIYFGDALGQAAKDGRVNVELIDQALIRRFTKQIEFGWFQRQPTTPAMLPVMADGKAAREIAAQSMVLLKNDKSLLPLQRARIRTIALLGPYAIRALIGGGGSSQVTPLYTVEPLAGLYNADPKKVTYIVQDGSDIAAAVSAAKLADVAVVMVGQETSEGHDHSLSLGDAQDKLVSAVARANPRTVVVLKTGSPVLMPWLSDVAAVLEAWYPGEEDGDAVADVLFGAVDPSGKLPITFPRTVDDTLARDPATYPGNGKVVSYKEGLDVGYRGYIAHGVKPLFPFGFGLSYTSFAFDDLSVGPVQSDGSVTVSLRITNTGSVPGADVAQLYVGYPPITEGNEPPLQLRAFQKVTLQPREFRTVTLKLEPQAFSYWSEKMNGWQVAQGKFQLFAGDSSANTPLHGSVNLP